MFTFINGAYLLSIAVLYCLVHYCGKWFFEVSFCPMTTGTTTKTLSPDHVIVDIAMDQFWRPALGKTSVRAKMAVPKRFRD
jgi:hypothetical protein